VKLQINQKGSWSDVCEFFVPTYTASIQAATIPLARVLGTGDGKGITWRIVDGRGRSPKVISRLESPYTRWRAA